MAPAPPRYTYACSLEAPKTLSPPPLTRYPPSACTYHTPGIPYGLLPASRPALAAAPHTATGGQTLAPLPQPPARLSDICSTSCNDSAPEKLQGTAETPPLPKPLRCRRHANQPASGRDRCQKMIIFNENEHARTAQNKHSTCHLARAGRLPPCRCCRTGGTPSGQPVKHAWPAQAGNYCGAVLF